MHEVSRPKRDHQQKVLVFLESLQETAFWSFCKCRGKSLRLRIETLFQGFSWLFDTNSWSCRALCGILEKHGNLCLQLFLRFCFSQLARFIIKITSAYDVFPPKTICSGWRQKIIFTWSFLHRRCWHHHWKRNILRPCWGDPRQVWIPGRRKKNAKKRWGADTKWA